MTNRMHHARVWVFAGAAAICAIGGHATAEVKAGEQEYMTHCAMCHGETAMGEGPLSELMKEGVPGLVGLAAANDGEFPWFEVFKIVDGRGGLRGHGSAMPVWGDHFSLSAREEFGVHGAEVVIRGRVAVLVDYLGSIQQ